MDHLLGINNWVGQQKILLNLYHILLFIISIYRYEYKMILKKAVIKEMKIDACFDVFQLKTRLLTSPVSKQTKSWTKPS